MAALPTILIPFMVQSTYSLPQTISSQYLVVPTDIDKPVCYMETTDGTTLNLTSMCGRNNKKNPQQRQSQSTEQSCANQDGCLPGFNSSGSLPPAVYIPSGSPNGF
jgi:hypothetical protein